MSAPPFRFISGANAPLFSVVIPCYNHALFLPEAVHSLTVQGVEALEAVIVNDGSSDDSAAVARTLMERYPGLQYLEQRNCGPEIARNAGIESSGGEWIVTLDSDDILAGGFLREVQKAVMANPVVNAVTGAFREFGARESEWKLTRFDPERLKERGNILNCAPFRKTLWAAVGGFDPSNPWGGEDWQFWLKASGAGLNLLTLPVAMLWYRIHEHAGRMNALRRAADDHKALLISMTPEIYPAARIREAQEHLLHMRPETEERLREHVQKHPDLPLPRFWLGLAHEGRGGQDGMQAARALYKEALDRVRDSDAPVADLAVAAQIQERLGRLFQG